MHCNGERGYYLQMTALCGNSCGLSVLLSVRYFGLVGWVFATRGKLPYSGDLMSTLLCSLLREANIERFVCIY